MTGRAGDEDGCVEHITYRWITVTGRQTMSDFLDTFSVCLAAHICIE